jgi:hypothetical protein
MKSPQTTASRTKPAKALRTVPAPQLPAAPPAAAESPRDALVLSADPMAQREEIKHVFVNVVGGQIFAALLKPYVSFGPRGDDGHLATKAAKDFVSALKDSIRPRDVIEEMLIMQMAWTHARLARLVDRAPLQENRENVRIVHDACDRAAATFRRQMLALAEYRRPPRTDAFVAIHQANLANQQVVNNAQTPNTAGTVASNELGLPPAKALPPDAGGAEIASRVGTAECPLAVEHRPAVEQRQEPEPLQRPQAR